MLPGGVHYGDELSRLFSVWGNPDVGCVGQLLREGCNSSSGRDSVGVQAILGARRTSPEAVRLVSVSSFSSKSTSTITDNTAAASRSRLKGWRTSTGVHVGMTWAEAVRRYPTRLHCAAPHPGTLQTCGFRTAPYRVTIDGHGRRQVFAESFSRATPDRPLVNQVGAGLVGEEVAARSVFRWTTS